MQRTKKIKILYTECDCDIVDIYIYMKLSISSKFCDVKWFRGYQKLRKVKDSKVIESMYWGSIVFDYYIRRIKKSSDIISE